MRERWIEIGRVVAGWYVLRSNVGTAGGVLMHWRGRVSWCQPCEFLDWPELRWAIRQRLRIAGLELAGLACPARKETGSAPVRVRALVRLRRD